MHTLSSRDYPHFCYSTAPLSPTRLDLFCLNVEGRVTEQQAKYKESHDACSRDRQYFVGQRVMTLNLQPGPKWIPGTEIKRNGPLSYLVQVRGEQVWK